MIIIIADDLGWGDVSAYGNRTVSTPNIDFLAQNGACFTNGHASSATSTPSRYGLMTGMYIIITLGLSVAPADIGIAANEARAMMLFLFMSVSCR